MKKESRKTTSISLIESEYKKFKLKSIDTGITLYEFVNASLMLYNKDDNYNTTINSFIFSGSIL